MKSNSKNRFKKVIIAFTLTLGLIFLLIFLSFVLLYHRYDLNTEKLMSLNNGIKVYSVAGTDTTLYNTNRSIVELNNLPEYVPQAFIDIEDKRFYKHKGYDLARIAKASLINLSTMSKSQGASTISQQLIKNALLSNEKTYSRKIKEIILAIKLEKQFSKDEILEMYLNTIYFGSNAFGIENASKTYFNKSASELTINEACCLAGLIKSPQKYSPKTNYKNSIQRRNLVAKTMLNLGNINKNEYQNIINNNLKITSNSGYNSAYEQHAIIEACSLLNISERELINKNYSIITYKNDELQKNVEEINKNILDSSKTAYNSNLDGLSLVFDNDGHVIAYYAYSNYNLTNITRQPASLIKPLAVYLPCFIHNILSPASIIKDEPINYSGYSPNNADGKFHGDVTIRDAVAYSYNIPAVKALDYVGVKNAKETLTKLGININNSDLNLSLALGSTTKGVNLLNLANAYSTLANKGINKGYTFIKQILDENGNIIYNNEPFEEKVFELADCFLMNNILKDTSTHGTAKRFNSLNLPVASKTGTAANSYGNTDIYNVAYTTEHTIFSWIANLKDNLLPSEMHSSVEPTQINKEILTKLYSNHTPNDFIKPIDVEYCPYDLAELESTKTFTLPNHNIERYIAYDYFKTSNMPQQATNKNVGDFNVDLQKNGAKLSFNAIKSLSYVILKEINGKQDVVAKISNTADSVEFIDNNIFQHDEIIYTIKNNLENSKSIKVRPKDYLINLLSSQITGKKKWLV